MMMADKMDKHSGTPGKVFAGRLRISNLGFVLTHQ